MDLDTLIAATIEFTHRHQAWAPAIVFVFGFLESLAFLSLLVPSTVILLGIGGLFGASSLNFWPLLVAGGVGASLGYAISYWIGRRYQEPILRAWPFSKHPDMVARSHRFFQRFGIFSVFLGHFFGPVRAVIPVIAGVSAMRERDFQIANIPSGFLWAFFVIAPGYFATSAEAKSFWDFIRSWGGG